MSSQDLNQNPDQRINMRYVTLVSMIAAFGGLLFGFDTAVVSGAIGFMEQYFDLNEVQVGWAVSSLIIGCIVGAAIAGVLGDRFGRKKVLIMAAILFIISSVGTAIPETFAQYIMARIIGGLGIGITSTLCPLYNAEISPAKMRGRLVSLNQLATVTGIFLVYFTNLALPRWEMTPGMWRWPGGICSEPELSSAWCS
jgi:SP family arabinose:H+ symporter-like MFS transporter